MFENSQHLHPQPSDFSKSDTSRSSSFRPVRDDDFDKEHEVSRSIESEERKPKWSSLTSEMLKEGDKLNVTTSSFRSTTTQPTPSSEPITETSRTNVSCMATPTVDRFGQPVIETITKTQREINGQPLPTETIRSKIPVEEIEALKQGQLHGRLHSHPLELDEIESETSESDRQTFPRQRISSSLKDTAKQATSSASETGSELLHQAKEWVHETAPKAKEALNSGAAKSYEWVGNNAPKAKVWVEKNAPKVQKWAEHQIHDVQNAASRLDTRRIKSYLPRKELIPLLASVLMALLLGIYLYRNAGLLGLRDESLVPLPDPLHRAGQAQQGFGQFTAYPQNRDYYQHEHIPHRLSELEEKFAAAAKDGLHSTASSSLHSAASQTEQAASQTKETMRDKVHHAADYVHDKVGQLEEKMKEKAEDLKHHLSGYADLVQQQAKQVESEAEERTKQGIEKGKEALNRAKEKASEISEAAKNELNSARPSSSSGHSDQPIRHEHAHEHHHEVDDHRQTPAGQGPYDEPYTPPHAHTYEHTLKGATEYLKDKVGEGLHSLGQRNGNGMPQQEQFR